MSPVPVYDVGDSAEFRDTFRDLNGALADPTTVTLRVRKPGGTIVGPYTYAGATISRASVGVFYKSVVLDAPGVWRAEWVTTGVPTVTDYDAVVARESQFSGEPDYVLSERALVTLEDALGYCEVDLGAIEFYDDVIRLINAVSVRAHDISGREIVPKSPTPETRRFDVARYGSRRYGSADVPHEIPVGDLAAEPTAVAIETPLFSVSTPLTAEELALVVALPRSRDEWEPIRRLRLFGAVSYTAANVVAVTGEWGFPVVPDDVREAALRQIKFWFSRDLEKFSATFRDAEGAAATDRVPDSDRSLLRSTYDVFVSYRDVGI